MGVLAAASLYARMAICVPQAATLREMSDKFTAWFALRRDLWERPAAEGVQAMMVETYPCR